MPPKLRKNGLDDPCPDVVLPPGSNGYELEEMEINGFKRMCCRCNENEHPVALCSSGNYQDRVCQEDGNADKNILITVPSESSSTISTLPSVEEQQHSTSYTELSTEENDTMPITVPNTTAETITSKTLTHIYDESTNRDSDLWKVMFLLVACFAIIALLVYCFRKEIRWCDKNQAVTSEVGKIPPTNFIQPTVPANRMDYDPKKLPSNSEGQALLSHNNENAISTDWNKHSLLEMKNFFANLGSHPTITLAPFDAKLYGENMGVGRIDIDDIVRHSGEKTPEMFSDILNNILDKQTSNNALLKDTFEYFSNLPGKRLLIEELADYLHEKIPKEHLPECVKLIKSKEEHCQSRQ